MIWIIEYDSKWLPICEIFGKSFRKLLSHAYNSHNLTSREYKIKFWLDIKKWICCNETKLVLQQHLKDNYDLVVKDNLLSKGNDTRFIKWNKKKKYVSEQTKIMLREHLKNINKPTK